MCVASFAEFYGPLTSHPGTPTSAMSLQLLLLDPGKGALPPQPPPLPARNSPNRRRRYHQRWGETAEGQAAMRAEVEEENASAAASAEALTEEAGTVTVCSTNQRKVLRMSPEQEHEVSSQ